MIGRDFNLTFMNIMNIMSIINNMNIMNNLNIIERSVMLMNEME